MSFSANDAVQAKLRKYLNFTVELFLIVFFSIPVQAQQTITTEAGATHRIYSPEDGIPSHSPTNAFITKDGYLWLSTTGGTVRISGNKIEDFGAEYGLNMMQHIYYDRAGDIIWFTDSKTLASFDGSQVNVYSTEDGFDPPGGGRKQVSPMLTDSQGRLWIGSYTPPFDAPYNGGLMLFEDGEFKTFTPEELPLHNISGIFEASDGSLWFTSQGYLSDGVYQSNSKIARYQNGEFEIFGEETGCQNVATTFRDPDGFTIGITEESRGNLWFNCNGVYISANDTRENYGLFVFDGNSFARVDWVNDRLSGPMSIADIFYHRASNQIYISLANQNGFSVDDIPDILMVFDGEEWDIEDIITREEAERLTGGYFENDPVFLGYYLTHTSDGSLLANLQIVEAGSNKLHSVAYRKMGDQWQWVDTTPGFFLINLAGNVFLTAQSEPDVIGIYTPPYSRLLTTEDGLLKPPAESTTGGSYYRQRFFTDANGNVWITYLNSWDAETETWDALGVSKWDGEQILNFSAEDGFSSNNLYYPNQSSDGALWFPSDNGMNRMVWNGDEFSITAFNDSEGQPFRSTKVVERANGEIFTYTNYVVPESSQRPGFSFFLGRFDGNAFQAYVSPYPDSLTALPYHEYELTADRKNRLWLNARFGASTDAMFTAPSHLRVLENESWVEPPAEWQVPDTRLFYVGELDNGRYFIVEGGFYKFDFDQQQFVDLSDSTNVNADFRILQRVNTSGMFFQIEGDGHLYIRFRDMGLAVFDGTNLTYLDRRNGLPSLRISYPHRDRNGELLFTTPTGGVIFNGPEFTAIRDDAVSGLTARGIARDKNNNILIQHLGLGMTVTQMDTTQYPVRISTILADTIRFYEGQHASLKSDQNNIEFRFATLNFTNPDDVQFSYLLEGYDSDWSRPSEANFIEFRNLPSGNYTFHVRSVGPGTVISEPAAFSFSIAPPWWRTAWAYGFYFLLFLCGVFATDRFQRRRIAKKEREKARKRELEQARQIEKAYRELEKAHENLKAAKNQLVQQEKLASLGQLTAGIAHEIKNPLNFVNNFSEVSVELVEEAREEVLSEKAKVKSEKENSPLSRGESEGGAEARGVSDGAESEDLSQYSETDSGSVNPPLNPLQGGEAGPSPQMDLLLEILDDIEANLRKIHEHGSRADGIVKSMLLHSRGGSGEMEPTHLNSMIKEYVNLAFHGMRAGKEPINVDIDLQLDENVGVVPLIAEDFSRVILNLCNNAFDAMREKQGSGHREQGSGGYEPKLTVRTKSDNGKIIIEIEDNGPGIPEEIQNKILQPFFTTKKGTEGTGLGLSITNDIVKAHGGNVDIDSQPGQTVFTITLSL